VSHRRAWGVLAVLVTACGSSSTGGPDGGPTEGVDNAPAFVATWNGTLTETETAPGTGEPQSQQVSLVIAEASPNTLSLETLCPDLSAVTASVTSATQFSLAQPFSCPTATVSSCNSVVFTYETLVGTLTGGALSITGSVTAAGCGVSASASLTFNSGAGTKN
jgi:hypothetical protein